MNINVDTIGYNLNDPAEALVVLNMPEVGDSVKVTFNDTVYNLRAYEPLEDYELPEGSIVVASQDPEEQAEPDQYIFLSTPIEDFTEVNSILQIALNGEHFDDDEHVETWSLKIEIV